MPTSVDYLAIDLGASSGRAVLGTVAGARLELREIHRFPNSPVRMLDRLYWDVPGLLREIKAALGRCGGGSTLAGIGIDTWGVDFGLLGRGGDLLDLPRHYRDARNRGMMERAFERVPRDELYARTGIQFLPFNTLFQLLAVAASPTRWLDLADRLLLMPDLLTYWLTGVAEAERSISSTSQMVNARTRTWDAELLARLGLPARILPPIRETGTVAGPLLPEVAEEVGLPAVPVIRTAAHDTAAAVAAVPAQGDDWAYISCGTWSLVGVELPAPLITPEALAANFTNEAGVGGTIRFLRNVAGLWLVQECQRTWEAAGQPASFAQLAELASAAAPRAAFIDPDDPRFADPGDMPRRIQDACAARGQPVPQTPGQIVRCILDSLALRHRTVLQQIEQLTGRRVRTVHLVGGGVQNELLCQLTADAAGRPVVAGPVEATAAGNILVQALAHGHVRSLAEIRQVVARSAALKHYEPRDTAGWDEAAARQAGRRPELPPGG